jgi:hypothetical protein
MARDHARILVAIWSDPEFRALPADPQRMYLLLVSQARLSYCGALDYLPSRFATLGAGETEETTDKAVRRLEHDRFVVVDRVTHELVVRSFVRHDGLLASPNVTKAMIKDRSALLSDELREVVDDELKRAFREAPKLAGWRGLKDTAPNLYAKVSGKGSRKGSDHG